MDACCSHYPESHQNTDDDEEIHLEQADLLSIPSDWEGGDDIDDDQDIELEEEDLMSVPSDWEDEDSGDNQMSSIEVQYRRLDTVVAQYYASCGRTDYYAAGNGNGKLLQYAIDEEFIDNEIEIEEQLADDCNPLDFTIDFEHPQSFPLPPHIHVPPEQRAMYMFRVLQHCYIHNEPPPIQWRIDIDDHDEEEKQPAATSTRIHQAVHVSDALTTIIDHSIDFRHSMPIMWTPWPQSVLTRYSLELCVRALCHFLTSHKHPINLHRWIAFSFAQMLPSDIEVAAYVCNLLHFFFMLHVIMPLSVIAVSLEFDREQNVEQDTDIELEEAEHLTLPSEWK